MEYLFHLSSEIGPRPGGSPANRAAAEYIRHQFELSNLEVEMQNFDCPQWEELSVRLSYEAGELEAAANAYSPPCQVSGQIVPISTVAELEKADLEGRIGLLYGDLTREPLSAKSWFLKSERDERVITLLEVKKPAALLTLQVGQAVMNRAIEDWEFTIPSASISPQAARLLLSQPEAAVSLSIDSRRSPGSTCNVVARKPGRRPEKIVLCAHYDTKIDTPGAMDNAAGAAALLALASRFSKKELIYGLEWISFANEEYLPIGDDEYLRQGGSDLNSIIAAINFDGIGHILASSSIAIFSASEAFSQRAAKLTQNYPGVVWVEPWPQSNHSTFAWRGVPSLAFSSHGSILHFHDRDDRPEWISKQKLEEVIELTADLLMDLQTVDPEWTRPIRQTQQPDE
jgi:aminopeptidase YwaD